MFISLQFAKGPLLKGLYWETWYNNQSVPDDQLGYIYYENKLLGVPRLRQLQVSSNSCVVHADFKDVIRECFESYSESLENKSPFGEKDNYTAYVTIYNFECTFKLNFKGNVSLSGEATLRIVLPSLLKRDLF